MYTHWPFLYFYPDRLHSVKGILSFKKKNASFQRGIAKALLISIFLLDDYLTVLILI